ncbi:hypothetical protein NMG60_11029343 [Bertholletia excelsa]
MAANSSLASPAAIENPERNLQPFFVLHKASLLNSERKPKNRSRVGTRRRIDLTSSLSKCSEQSKAEFSGECDDDDSHQLRKDVFHCVWSKIESTIKDVLKNINADVFNEIHCWVQESFCRICSSGTPDQAKATCPYPLATHPLSKQLCAGVVFTRNMELVDDLLTFQDLGLYLRSHGCYVANLSSSHFSSKTGIEGCIKGLLRQFLTVSLDVADISILASWYMEQGKYDKPVVIIIDEMERCSESVLSDFFLSLSEWVIKIPIILIIGVATTVDALRSRLPSDTLQRLSSHAFILGSPAERMDAIIEAVLVKQCSGFSVGYKVANFLRNNFIQEDGTLTSFVRALKIALAQHIYVEPLSFILESLFSNDSQALLSKRHVPSRELMFKWAFDLPSFRRSNELGELNGETLTHGLSDLKRLQKLWGSVVMCLYEAGKSRKISLLDLYCEALNPELYHSRDSERHFGLETDDGIPSTDGPAHEWLQNCGSISQLIHKGFTSSALSQLLNSWEKHTEDVPEDMNILNEKGAALINCMVKDYMLPIECIPFHEIVCFKDVEKLQSALMGDPRRTIQVDLLDIHKFLKCSCCSKSSSTPLPSMHDTSIMYMLAQEHGDLINLHDWYQSFKANILLPKVKGKHRLKVSPSPKKRKGANESQIKSEASLQAQFCRAVTELQITGLLRMPSKRRPDFVQRVAFGL